MSDTEYGLVGDIGHAIVKGAKAAVKFPFSDDREANARFAYELWRAKHWNEKRFKGKHDRAMWNYWLANVAAAKHKGAKYQGRNEIVPHGWAFSWEPSKHPRA